MATFQVSNKNKNKSNKNVKVITGWIMLACSTFIFLFAATNLLPFLKTFFMGVFGVFVYPLCVICMIISLALLNNKKYVMPKSYAIFLILSLYFLLSIIQLIILGKADGLTYGQYVGLNYSKQMTAGGVLIGFIPSTLLYLMGPAATYIILSLALITCVAFFVQAYLSIKKTKEVEKPIKLQLREKDNINSIEDRRDAKVFKNEANLIAKEQPQEEVKEKSEVQVMLEGYQAQEEKKERNARELLGLVGGNKQMVQGEEYKPHNMTLPEAKPEEKVPEGMSMREYLLSPPKVDLKKFREQQERHKPNRYANYVLNNNMPAQNSIETQSIAVNAQQVQENINQLKNEDEIVDSMQPEEQVPQQNVLPQIKPEEITNEAEDIIRAVVEQEKQEREQFVEENQSVEEAFIEEIVEEEQIADDYNDFIDFEDVEEKQPQQLPPSRDNFANNRDDFSRDLGRRDNFSRDSLSSRDNLGQRDALGDRNANFGRDNLANREDLGQRDRVFERPAYNDEMQRRRDFVETIPEKKEEKFVPYKYTRPSLDLITTTSDDPATFNGEMSQKTIALENALESFGIPAKVQTVVIGPTVTRYEIEMPEGISVKKILSLDADIAYALCANGQIRIEAPIPGRGIVGIEVPNAKVAKVSIKDVLNSKEFNLSPSPLTFALGKDITGNVKVCNLQKMPHLLVAGTTGSGKSVCLNSIIISLLYKSSPDDVKFIMIDPKQVELSMYEGLPHMIIPKVITDATKAVNALSWAVDEMERRFRLIAEAQIRNIEEYNKTEKVIQGKAKKMPYIVIIFDEFADFMAIAKNEIEDKIRRIAQKARAAGIHLILATQRPSTDVVTGTLKSNLPARIAFKVASRVDSEVIMGATGAEKLLGYGDMLYKPTDSGSQRIQGCFIDTAETKNIVNFIQQNNEETFDAEALEAINNPNKNKNNGGGEDVNKVDTLLAQALKICIDNGVASTTMIQRKLSIGYPRAAKIIDQMEERGYISPADGAKQRAVYISIEEFYGIFGDIYD